LDQKLSFIFGILNFLTLRRDILLHTQQDTISRLLGFTFHQAKFSSVTFNAAVNIIVKDRPGLQYSYTAYRLIQPIPRLLQRGTETELKQNSDNKLTR
jgi:hypothetical protein